MSLPNNGVGGSSLSMLFRFILVKGLQSQTRTVFMQEMTIG